MLEKSSAAVQTAPSRPLIVTAKTESLSQRIEGIYNRIAQRAYDLFESKGREHGHDIEHWLDAEDSVLQPMQVQLEDSATELTVRAEVPGFTSDDIEIHAEPEQLTITGSRQSKTENKAANAMTTEESSEEIFRKIPLPTKVDTAKVSATLKNGTLTVKLPKVAPPKSAPTGLTAS
jgi:HSP20 family molecular chaperone IbpA